MKYLQQSAARQFTVQTTKTINNDNMDDTACQWHDHHNTTPTNIHQGTIKEPIDKIEIDIPLTSMTTLEKKAYTASYHKHQRGYIPKLNPRMHNSQKLQYQHGIVKFNVITAQNNTKAMHIISNKYHYRNIKPLAESRIALEGISLNATGTGYIPRICLEEREIILVECL